MYECARAGIGHTWQIGKDVEFYLPSHVPGVVKRSTKPSSSLWPRGVWPICKWLIGVSSDSRRPHLSLGEKGRRSTVA